MKTKLEMAKECIQKIRTSNPDDLADALYNVPGEELAGFMFAYADKLLKAPNSGEAARALMLMGYLIRVNEEKETEKEMIFFGGTTPLKA